MFAIEEVSGAPTVKAALEARALDELEGWHVGGLLASQLDMWRAIEVLNRDHLSVSFTPHQHLPAPPTGISEPLHPHPSPTLTAAVGGSVRRQRASLDTLKVIHSYIYSYLCTRFLLSDLLFSQKVNKDRAHRNRG